MKLVTDPAHVLQQNLAFHEEAEADTYDQRMGVRHDDEAVAELVGELERVLGEPLPRGGVVADIGAGTGHVAVKLARLGRFERVFAVDISPRMLERASASASALGVPLETRVSDLQRLPFDDGQLDLVVGCAVLHHLPDPAALMVEVARVLRPGGRAVFIGEPSAWGQRLAELVKTPALTLVRLARLVGLRPPPVWDHESIDVHTFSLADIERLTAGHFADVRVVCEGFAEPMIDQGLLVLVQRALGRVPGVAGVTTQSRRILRRLDVHLFDRVLPKGVLASVKLAVRRG